MNILITSVGRRSYMVKFFKNALNGKGLVHVSNSSDITPAFQVADRSIVTPLIYDDNYIPFLLKYCKKNQIDILISLFDIDLYVLASHKEDFSKIETKVIVSDPSFIKTCNDKWLTYHYLKENNFNVPATYLELKDAIQDIRSDVIHYPVVVKPRWGMGSLSIYIANNEEELKVFYKKIKNEIQNSYICYESQNDLEHSVMIQEFISGQEYGLDIINDLDGTYQNTIVRKKYAMRAGETDCAEIVENKSLKDLGKRLGNITGHIANLDVDVLCDENNVFILEMNARFGGGYPFSHIAGVDLPLAIVKWCQGEEIDKNILSARENTLGHKDIAIMKLK